jgi:hypothetical protein
MLMAAIFLAVNYRDRMDAALKAWAQLAAPRCRLRKYRVLW